MSNQKIYTAFVTKLLAMPSGLTDANTHLENEVEPLSLPIQQVYILPADSQMPDKSGGPVRFVGYIQVNVKFDLDSQRKQAGEYADQIAAYFKRGLSIPANGFSARVGFKPPTVRQGRPEGDRFVIPVRIPYWADVYS